MSEEIKKIARQVRGESKRKSNQNDDINLIRTPTKITLVDLSVSGIPYGMVNFIGDSSSGKTGLANEFLNSFYRIFDGKIDWFYDNKERGNHFDFKKLYGFDLFNDCKLFKGAEPSKTVEDFDYNLNLVAKRKDKDKPFVYILDSFDALTSEAEEKFVKQRRNAMKKKKKADSGDSGQESTEEKEKGTYNLNKQKGGLEFGRLIDDKLRDAKIFLIIISQSRKKIGVFFGSPDYRTGGAWLDFYPNVVLWLAESEKYSQIIGGRTLTRGYSMKIRPTKTRTETPFREIFLDILFDYGVDNVASNIIFLYDLKDSKGKEKKDASKSIEWDGDKFTKKTLINYIEENNLEAELEKRVKEKWAEIEKSISSKDRKRRW